MTPAAAEALQNLRDPSRLQWYVVPFLAFVMYAYAVEVERRNWNVFFAGLAFWGMDWLNEIANALIFHATGRAPLWTAPGETAYLILIGLNIEICFMFAIGGIVMSKMLPRDPAERVLGMPNRLFVALTNSIFCVIVEVFLNRAGIFVWEYWFWTARMPILIVIFGYLTFHVVAFWVHDLPTIRGKIAAVATIWGIAGISILVFGVGLRWI
jgi:hypothetical protein